MNNSQERLSQFQKQAEEQNARNIGTQVFKAAEVSSDQQFAIAQDSERLAYSAEEAADVAHAAQQEEVERKVYQWSGLHSENAGEPGGMRDVVVDNESTQSVLSVDDWKVKEAALTVDNTQWTVNPATNNDALTGTSTTRELVLDDNGVAQRVKTTREMYDGTGNKSVYATDSSNPKYVEKVQRRIAKETDRATHDANALVNDYKSGALPKEIPTK